MKAIAKTVYQCSKCGLLHDLKESAEKCCSPKSCAECGTLLENKYYNMCPKCRKKHQYDNCVKMTYDEYVKKYPNHMVVYDEVYAEEIEDLFDTLFNSWDSKEDIPIMIFGTKKYKHEVNIEWAIENAKEEAYEDAEFDNTDELREFVNEWNEKNHLHSFSETNIAIYVPDDITKEYAKRLH